MYSFFKKKNRYIARIDVVRTDGHEHTLLLKNIRNEEEALQESMYICKYSSGYYKDGWYIFSNIDKFKLTIEKEK